MAPVDLVRLARTLIDIDSDHRPRGRGCRLGGEMAPAARLRRRGAAGWPPTASTSMPRSTRPKWCCRRTSTACPRSFRAARRTAASTGAGACDAKGILAAQMAALERLRGKRRERRVGAAGRRRRGARQPRRPAPPTSARRGRAISSTASRRTTAWPPPPRALYRVRLSTSGRAAHSAYPELGESAIEKLVDALGRAARPRPAGRPGARSDNLHGRTAVRRAWRRTSCRRWPRRTSTSARSVPPPACASGSTCSPAPYRSTTWWSCRPSS